MPGTEEDREWFSEPGSKVAVEGFDVKSAFFAGD
jgi:hypothetical protein